MKTEFHNLSIEEEKEILKILHEIRNLLWDESSEEFHPNLISFPVDCASFAKWWIEKQYGIFDKDKVGFYPFKKPEVEK